jgi:prevent-host-death family protein
MAVWQLQEAKQRFSELIKSVESEGPQIVTRHGHEVAVVITMAEYRHLKDEEKEEDFKAFLQSAPDVDLDISRPVEFPRQVILDEEDE